jgi:hypothetical protein
VTHAIRSRKEGEAWPLRPSRERTLAHTSAVFPNTERSNVLFDLDNSKAAGIEQQEQFARPRL